ncbi:unnamed protein product [Pedinophyceae sp. YPF-701]|nr:unnamed protein product [Pedinophyceae sp. YPF-701]
MSGRVKKVVTPPINQVFKYLQSQERIQVWLFEQKDLKLEGVLVGFDEFMNLVLDSAEEVSVKKKTRKALGRVMLKGDNVTLLAPAQPPQ